MLDIYAITIQLHYRPHDFDTASKRRAIYLRTREPLSHILHLTSYISHLISRIPHPASRIPPNGSKLAASPVMLTPLLSPLAHRWH